MKIAIAGGTGFVGTQLVSQLQQIGESVLILTRNPQKTKQRFPQAEIISYDPTQSGEWQKSISGCNVVINLAGEAIADKRWTPSQKAQILSSREITTQKIIEAIKLADPKPNLLINASAIGYYGTSETATFDENSPPANDFLAQVCQTWETQAQKVTELGTRLVILRLGIILGTGGALAKMTPVFKIYAGGPLGTGNQWFSWIHIKDLINLILYAIKTPDVQGIYNATSPNPVKMNQLCQVLGEVMNRPSWLPVPKLALELILGEGSKLILEGQQVLPKRTLASGFTYQYPNLKSALQDILAS